MKPKKRNFWTSSSTLIGLFALESFAISTMGTGIVSYLWITVGFFWIVEAGLYMWVERLEDRFKVEYLEYVEGVEKMAKLAVEKIEASRQEEAEKGIKT